VRWATRASIHVDRASSAWLICRFIDPEATTFEFVTDPGEVPSGTVPFDMRGAEFGHHGHDCTFETLLRRHDLDDPALWRIAQIIHEADLDDELFDAPEAIGVDVVLRGLSMICGDEESLTISGRMFDGLYEFFRRELLLGREPS